MCRFYLKVHSMKRFLFALILIAFGLSSFAQTDSPKQAAKLDSIYFAEMMSRREVDEFTDEIKIDFPVLGNQMCTIHISKSIFKGKIKYYLSLMSRGLADICDRKGAIILYTNGIKLTKPDEKIDVKYSDNLYEDDDIRSRYKYIYRAFVSLTPADLKILS